MAAVSRGCPVLSAAWLRDCAAAGRLLDPEARRKAHVLLPARPALRASPLLAGLRLAVAGDGGFAATFADVLRYAGELMEAGGWSSGRVATGWLCGGFGMLQSLLFLAFLQPGTTASTLNTHPRSTMHTHTHTH